MNAGVPGICIFYFRLFGFLKPEFKSEGVSVER